MSGSDTVAGLADSAFLADIDAHDRDTARLALTLAGGVTLGLVVGTLVNIAVGGLPRTLQDLLLATAADGLAWLTFVALAAAITHHRLRAYLTAALRFRWRLLALGLGLALVAMAPVAAVDVVSGSPGRTLAQSWNLIAPDGLVIAALWTVLLIPAAMAEELFFRGWLLRQTAAFTRQPLFLMGFTALVFSGLHRDFSPDAFLARVLMGIGFAYMTLRLGGIEFSSGVHAANNILVVLFVEPLSMGVPNPGAGFFVETGLKLAALFAGYFVITELVARTPRLLSWAGVRPDEISRVRYQQTPSFS